MVIGISASCSIMLVIGGACCRRDGSSYASDELYNASMIAIQHIRVPGSCNVGTLVEATNPEVSKGSPQRDLRYLSKQGNQMSIK